MDKKDLRRRNLQMLREALRKLRQASKPRLAEETGLSVVTVNSLMHLLLEKNEAEPVMEATSTGGRPARQYRFRGERRLAIACYMYAENNRDMMVVFVVNLLGEIVEQKEVYPEAVTKEIFPAALQPLLKKYPQTALVVVGMPGTEINGSLDVVDYPALKGMPFSRWLSAELNRPVHFTNNIHAAVAGSGSLFGKTVVDEVVVGVYWAEDSPPEAGIFLKGKLYTGRDGIAGELGHRFQKEWQPPKDAVREAVRVILLMIRTWNPHGMILYNDKLRMEDLPRILELCGREIPARFLPTVVVRPDIREDYGQGVYALAGKYLEEIQELEK
ncbi:MAG: ROK family protein [Selenomonadaceae bacterium]|nr:ROK family protein [Selenomonadaceae bacterium]